MALGEIRARSKNCTPPTKNYAKPRQWQKSGTSKARTTTNISQQHPANKNPTSSPSSSRYLGVICPSPQVFHCELHWQAWK